MMRTWLSVSLLWQISFTWLLVEGKKFANDEQKKIDCLFKVLTYKGNILAVGDSLTRGYVKEGKFRCYLNPFTNEMKRLLTLYGSKLSSFRLNEAFVQNSGNDSNRDDITMDFNPFISEKGQNGETTEFLFYRLPQILKNQSELSKIQFSNYSDRIQNRNFSVIIILSGTNDLGYKINADFVVTKLIAIHRLVHEYGAISIAVTLPPLFWPPPAMSIRSVVNERLRQYATEASIPLLDLGAFFDRNQTKVENGDDTKMRSSIFIEGNPNDWMSSDKVHLSKFGYDQLGKYLFLTLLDMCNSSS